VFWDHFLDADPEVAQHSRQALQDLVALGAEVVNISIPNLAALSMAHGIAISCEFSFGQDHLFHSKHPLEPNTVIQLGIGNSITAKEFLASNWLRGWAFERLRTLFAAHRLTAIVTPTMGSVAPVLDPGASVCGESNTALIMQMMKHIFIANLVGFPAVSVPVGYSTEGLPVGLHLMADHWEEATLLRLSVALEGRLQRRRPTVFYDVQLSDRSSAPSSRSGDGSA